MTFPYSKEQAYLRPISTCPKCGTLTTSTHDLIILPKETQKGKLVYHVDFADEVLGVSFFCPNCKITYDVADCNLTLSEREE